jgi:ATP-dependent RNA helicase DDX18/HAS1
VDWVVQYDAPDEATEYIHRVGRTARGSGGRGRSLLFLQPSEVGFLKYLKEARVPVVEFDFPAKRIVNVQSQLEKLITGNYYLNKVINPPLLIIPGTWLSRLARAQKKHLSACSTHTPRTVYDPSSTCTSWIW